MPLAPVLMRPGANTGIAVLLFGGVFVAHLIGPVAQSGDSFWTVPVMLSLLCERNTNLDEYSQLLREKKYVGVECVTAEYHVFWPDPARGCPDGSHYYYWYPIGTPFVALPLMMAMDASLRVVGPTVDRIAGDRVGAVAQALWRRNYLASHLLVEVAIASTIVALTAVLLLFTARVHVGAAGSIALALLFAFGTSAWSTASRALWQHGPAMLMITAALYLLSLAATRPALLPWAAAPLALAYFMRPTAGIVLVLMGAYVLIHHRLLFAKWLLAAAAAAPFLVYNFAVYHQPLQSYFMLSVFLAPKLANLGKIFSAFAGTAISPSRGLFIFSPFLLFSVAGIWFAVRRKWMMPLSYYLAAAPAVHWLALSDFVYWTAGHSYGPPLFTDVLPLLLFFLIPAFLWLRLDKPRRPLSIAFYLCVLISAFIHFRGAMYWAPYEWNGHPSEVSAERVWDWRDPQFLRGVCGKIRK